MGRCATALVSDIHTAEVAYTPYQRPPDAAAIRTPIPRGLKSFVVRGAVLAAKPVDDTELLTIALTLPAGFGYVVNEIHCNIIVDTADDWNGFGIWRLSQSSPANNGFDYRFLLPFSNTSQNGSTLGVRGTRQAGQHITRTPIVPPREGSTQSLSFTNLNAAVQAAGTVDALLSFWEYDLEQLAWYPAHVAASTYVR